MSQFTDISSTSGRLKRTGYALAGLLVLVVSVLAWRFYGPGVGNATRQISQRIESDIRTRNMPDDAPWRDRRTQALVRAFYKERRMRPAWTDGAGPLPQARELAEVVTRAEDEGLNPEDYSATELESHWRENRGKLLTPGDPRALAEFDLLCTIAAFHYMSDVFDGRISPKALDAAWVTTARRGDLDSLLQQALRRNRVKATLLGLAPTQEPYRQLRAARARYARLVEAGGWQPIPAGPPLHKGQRGRRVDALRARLIASGDLAGSAGATGIFDGTVEAAVKRFQARSGREPDGVVREPELADLNVSALYRLRQIELNMERWRWLPASFGDRYLIVNIPEYALRVQDHGREVLGMRVVVGKVLTATPVFSDRMSHVVVNPTWNVPASIARTEFAAAVEEDPEYLSKNGIRVFETDAADAREVDAEWLNWADSASIERLSFRQDAGEENALGRIKFLLPNRFDIYLHDTPAGHLFAREQRGYSHGCVRVEDPFALARYVLRGSRGASPGEIEELVDRGETVTLALPRPLPVHIVYFTAIVEGGAVGFREDVYGIDRDQIAALRSRSSARERQAS